jgi:hypothetical protein
MSKRQNRRISNYVKRKKRKTGLSEAWAKSFCRRFFQDAQLEKYLIKKSYLIDPIYGTSLPIRIPL